MPSTTRGSILISTANDIGEALVEKLGGVGYSPNEWKEKYNLCGIAPVDSAPALSVLADSAGTGDERGSILIATADAIGAILNKKYNVLRGFKPKEWASACRKMKALEEGSVASASIASFSDGADTVPLTSCVCSIDANLDGKTAVNAVHARKNLFNVADYSQIYTDRDGVDSYNYRYMIIQLKPNTTYTISQNSGAYASTPIILINNALPVGGTNYFDLRKASDTKTYTTDSTGRLYIGSINSYDDVAYARLQVCNVQIEVGSAATAYEPYQTPETKTADLGRAVYGGSADIIKGEGTESAYKLDDFTDITVINNSTTSGSRTFRLNTPSDHYRKKDLVIMSNLFTVKPLSSAEPYCVEVTDASSNADVTHGIYFSLPLSIAGAAEAKQWLIDNNAVFVYNVETPVDFTFEPVKIDSFPGVNNIWNDCGNTAVEYYQAPTPYARKTATGGIANFSDQRTDLPLTKAIANIAPSIAGKSAVNLVRTGASLAEIADVSGNMTNSYFYNIGSDYVLTAGTTYKIAMEVNSTVTPFAVSVGVGDNAYRYDIYNTGINNKNGVVAFEFTVEASHLATWNKLWIRAPRYSAPGETSTPTTCTFTVKNITLYSTATTYTAELGETVYGGSVDFVSGEVVNDCAKDSMSSSYLSGLSLETYIGYEAQTAYFNYHPSIWVRNWNYQTAAARTAGGIKCACDEFPASMNNTTIFASQYRIYFDVNGKNISSVQDFIDYVANLEQNGKQLEITYELAAPTESTIPGRVISPIEGVNNYWNDAGGDTEIQYFENEA